MVRDFDANSRVDLEITINVEHMFSFILNASDIQSIQSLHNLYLTISIATAMNQKASMVTVPVRGRIRAG